MIILLKNYVLYIRLIFIGLSFILTSCFSFTLHASTILVSPTDNANSANPIKNLPLKGQLKTKSGNSTDFGVINKPQILYWLEKRGILGANASAVEKEKAISAYLANRSSLPKEIPGSLRNKVKLSQKLSIPKSFENIRPLGKNEVSHSSSIRSASAEIPVTSSVKVLVILIDFPNLKYNANGLNSDDTSMYYDDYSQAHYNNLLFSKNGYQAPSGKTIDSVYQYYQQESGGSLAFTGEVVGWITASHDAEYYGRNNSNGGEDNVPELISEAVGKVVDEHGIDLSDYDKSDFFDLDGDGNINEPDGIIDHVMVFHSSIGEESGGGVLGEEAIWSQRFFVTDNFDMPATIPKTDTKLYGYTIAPIDAAIGVVAHEFGHDLGVEDEYDSTNGAIASPVEEWSIMSSGSWLGSPLGTRPSSFSPYATDYFQHRYGGNWINQKILTFDNSTEEMIHLVSANNHDGGINQVKIELPIPQVEFGAPYSGEYQFYSQSDDSLNNSMAFSVTLPRGDSTLRMKARWSIEPDYDYVQIFVNNVPITGNHTIEKSAKYNGVYHYITGESKSISGHEGILGWQDLIFDLSDYANLTVDIKIVYVTDQSVYEYGFVVDDISINHGAVFMSGAESTTGITLVGFEQVAGIINGKPHSYYLQLRDHTKNDSDLSSVDFEPGLLVWYQTDAVVDNNVNEHPGEVFIGVVDADQHAIKNNGSALNTVAQIHDAAFSLYDQKVSLYDYDLMANSLFDDRLDYSSPFQPGSGILLPKLGLTVEIINQQTDSANASLIIKKSNLSYISSFYDNASTVTFSIADELMLDDRSFHWDFGDNTGSTSKTPSHRYTTAGTYSVSVTYQTSNGEVTLDGQVTIIGNLTAVIRVVEFGTSVTFEADVTGGSGDYTYHWDFGDVFGGRDNATGITAKHSYAHSGDFTTLLTVFDGLGQGTTFKKQITVDDTLIASMTTTIRDVTVEYSGQASGGAKSYSYLWDFGDGTTSNKIESSHTYSQEGSYEISLQVTDGNNQVTNITKYFTVSDTISAEPSSSSGAMSYLLMLSIISMLIRLSNMKKIKNTNNKVYQWKLKFTAAVYVGT